MNYRTASEFIALHEELAKLSNLSTEEFQELIAKYDSLDMRTKRIVAAMTGATEQLWREQAHRDAAKAYDLGYRAGRISVHMDAIKARLRG